jgi:hypothetical protein
MQTGEWVWTGGDYPGASGDKGIKTSQDARFYSLTAPFDVEFDNKGKDLVLSYTVKHEQNIDCGGAYIKVRGSKGWATCWPCWWGASGVYLNVEHSPPPPISASPPTLFAPRAAPPSGL